MMREALLLQRQNRLDEAAAVYGEVLRRWPALADAWFNLATLQRQRHLLPEALESYGRALAAGIARAEEVHVNRAVILTDYLGQHDAAERELKVALGLNPTFAPAWLNLGALYEDLGRREEAASAYESLLRGAPAAHEALARLAGLAPAGTAQRAMIPRLQAALATAPNAADRASLGFALGRLLDAVGDYDAAFRAYAAANAASRASAPPGLGHYDRRAQSDYTDRLIASGASAALTPDRPTAAGPQPIFVCGMFRSGSTLAEQLLAGIPGVAAGGELDILPRLIARELTPFPQALAGASPMRLQALAQRYLAELAQLAPHARWVIDKRPDNFLYVGLIKRLFPQARIVHTTRNALDNCLSIYFLHLDQQLGYALDLMDIGHYFSEYRRLMAHWKALYGPDIHDFDYDALVADPQPALSALCRFLDLPWSGGMPQVPAAGRAIKTASVWQVREPLYRHSSGRARHYETQLRALAEFLSRSGAD